MAGQVQLNFDNLNFSVPIVASDGNVVVVTNEGLVNLLFFQMRGQNGNELKADVVAAVRLHTLQELKNFRDAITETLQKHENKEP